MNEKPEYILVKPDPATDAELVALEEQKKQLSWFIQIDGTQVGTARIEREDSEYVESPTVTVTVEEEYQGRGIGSSVMKEMISYAYRNLPYEILYSRHQTADTATEKLNKKLGFEVDEKPYTDDKNREWQNVKLVL